MHVRLYSPRDRLHERDWTDELFAALTAKRLPRLNCTAASIAEHDALRIDFLKTDSENHAGIHKTPSTIPSTKDTQKERSRFRFPHSAVAASLLRWRRSKEKKRLQ
jgi:hypothetical protein